MRLIVNYFRNQIAKLFLWLYIRLSVSMKFHRKVKKQAHHPCSVPDKLPPARVKRRKLNYRELIQQYQFKTGKILKPVKHRFKNTQVPDHIHCPHCDAPHQYIYRNNGKKLSQYQCKVCQNTFADETKASQDFILQCPYCGHRLNVCKTTKNKNVHRCPNKKCPYKRDHKQSLRYQFPIYHFLQDLVFPELPNAPYLVNLSKIRFHPHTFNLVISHLLMGYSSREISHYLLQMYGLSISHQTVINYRNTFVALVYPLLQQYLGDFQADHVIADETYFKNGGVWNYLFLAIDKDSNAILHFNPAHERDAHNALIMIADILGKTQSLNLELTTDKAPIYYAAIKMIEVLFPDISIIHHTVKGLQNEPGDDESANYRHLKNRIERLNRQVKKFINPKYGFSSDFGAFADFTLFTLGHNFLFDYAGKPPPLSIPEIQGLTLPSKVAKLIILAQKFAS